MKITMDGGITFEGTQAEYEAFLEFAERKAAEQEAPKVAVELTKGDSVKILGLSKYNANHIGQIGIVDGGAKAAGYVYVKVDGKNRIYDAKNLELVAKVDDIITFEGAEYRKVDREAREGDVVIFRATDSTAVDNDVPYLAETLVVHRKEEPTLAVRGACNCRVCSNSFKRTRETVDVYAPIAESVEKPKYEPKVGDIVVVTTNVGSHGYNIGDLVEITRGKLRKGGQVKGTIYKGDVPPCPFLYEEEFRPATAEEIAQYEKAVADAEKRKAEEAKWAKLGRKVNEYKVGDIVEGERNSEPGEFVTGVVEDVDGGGSVGINVFDSGDYRSITVTKLIAPVESVLTHN